MGEHYNDCSAEQARIAELEAYIQELEEKIQCLEAEVSCLEGVVSCLENLISHALVVAEELASWLQDVLDAAEWVLSHTSGIRRGTWGYALGSKAVGEQALAGVGAIIDILSQDCGDCSGGC